MKKTGSKKSRDTVPLTTPVVYSVYSTNQFQTTFAQRGWGGGVGVKSLSRVD
jgi:hypothetical protein